MREMRSLERASGWGREWGEGRNGGGGAEWGLVRAKQLLA